MDFKTLEKYIDRLQNIGVYLLSFIFLTLTSWSVTAAGSEARKAESGKRPSLNYKIINGDLAKSGQFPWFVSIGNFGKSTYSGHKCGGSIIAPTLVLTAAHCVDNFNAAREVGVFPGSVRLGINSRYRIRVSSIMIHGDYKIDLKADDRPRAGADIAILEVAEPFVLDERTVMTVPVMTKDQFENLELVGGKEKFHVAGFGATTPGGSNTSLLFFVEIPSLGRKKCNHPSAYDNMVLEDMICAGSTAGHPEGTKDACDGDSGGALLYYTSNDKNAEDAFLLGLVSWGGRPEQGRNCGDTLMVGVYTNAAFYQPWISQCIENYSNCLGRRKK